MILLRFKVALMITGLRLVYTLTNLVFLIITIILIIPMGFSDKLLGKWQNNLMWELNFKENDNNEKRRR